MPPFAQTEPKPNMAALTHMEPFEQVQPFHHSHKSHHLRHQTKMSICHHLRETVRGCHGCARGSLGAYATICAQGAPQFWHTWATKQWNFMRIRCVAGRNSNHATKNSYARRRVEVQMEPYSPRQPEGINPSEGHTEAQMEPYAQEPRCASPSLLLRKSHQ